MLPVLALSMVLSWVQVQSDTFVVKSSVGMERAKRVLRELEAFHQLIGTTVVFRKVELPELPIEVLLIGDETCPHPGRLEEAHVRSRAPRRAEVATPQDSD